MSFDRVWLNAHLATMRGDGLGLVEDGAVAAKNGRIAWVGPRGALPAGGLETTDCGGAWILPLRSEGATVEAEPPGVSGAMTGAASGSDVQPAKASTSAITATPERMNGTIPSERRWPLARRKGDTPPHQPVPRGYSCEFTRNGPAA